MGQWARSRRLIGNTWSYPEQRPDIKPVEFSLDGGGRELLFSLFRDREYRTLLEVGAFLGDFTTKVIRRTPIRHVVAVDLWGHDCEWMLPFAKHFGVALPEPQRFRHSELGQPNQDSFLQAFLSNTWELREHISPVREDYRRGSEPEPYSRRSGSDQWVMDMLAETGFQPDAVYWDADKHCLDEMIACQELWPDALVSGDDWEYREGEHFPIRGVVEAFCREKNYFCVVRGATWYLEACMDDEQPRVIYTKGARSPEADLELPVEHDHWKSLDERRYY